MKKLVVAIIAIMYMGVSSGIALEIHYCMGKKAGVSFYESDSKACGKCGMKDKKGGCCNDKHQFYKLKDAHQAFTGDISIDAPVVAVLTTHFSFDDHLVADVSDQSLRNHSPPDYSGPSAYIRNCVFRL